VAIRFLCAHIRKKTSPHSISRLGRNAKESLETLLVLRFQAAQKPVRQAIPPPND